ncbi:MAG: dTDP-4-dehydrorhamnose reductase [Burkholderiaceae bacterium]
MKVLVTGSNGQVGSELARSLREIAGKPVQVFAFDRSQMDLGDPAQVREVIRRIRPSLIVNSAAYTAVDQAEVDADMAMRVNGDAPGLIGEEARRCGAALIHYSTDYVFDGEKQGPYCESDLTCPINVYGRTKLAGEQAIAASGVLHLILRTSWVYGMHGKNFLKTIQRLASERDTLRVVADQIGAPTWSRTIAKQTAVAIGKLCDTPDGLLIDPRVWACHGGVYHLTAQGHTSWHGFATKIVAHGPRAAQVRVVPISTDEYPVPAPRPRNSQLSCVRYERSFGPLPAWDAALADCLSLS